MLIQIVVTAVYILKTRKIGQINWITKIIMIMASVSGIILLLLWTGKDLKWYEHSKPFFPICKILIFACYGTSFRFVRV